jgi:uncharacterized protein
MPLFVILRRTSTNWVTGTPAREQPFWDEHAQAIDQLYDAGKLVLAGPFTDGSGALTIVSVENEQEARTIFDNDIWVHKDMLDRGEIKPWQMFLNKLK